MLSLYHSLVSTCSQKVRLCLHHKGLDYESRLVNLISGEQLSPAYLAINPNGVVPSLVHDGAAITDSSVIMEYLDEVFPETPLMPEDAVGKAQVRAWMRYIEEVPTAAIRFPSFNDLILRAYEDMPEDAFRDEIERRPLRKHFYEQMGQTGFDQKTVDASMERLRQTMTRIDTATGRHRFVAGDAMSIADFALVPTVDRLHDLGRTEVFDGLPNLARWWQDIVALPAFAAAYPTGSRLSEVFARTAPQAACD
ncbi:MAG: glutathione S-transferase family protein [Pseudomonadota bacterium]|nr:glutathione S-transferase family protein [Pseudomonadota bacterium]